MTVDYRTGQVLDQIRQLPDASVDLVATSPPFLALRDYNGQPGQWGSEPDPASFLDHLLELTTELWRVLAPHGSIAIELGDTYSGSGGPGGDYAEGGMRDGQPRFDGSAARLRRAGQREGWPALKSLCGTPTLFAWSLAYGRNLLRPEHQVDPWLVRNVIVWARNNPPVGALGDKVRPATSYITVATPSPRRWFDLDAVRTDYAPITLKNKSRDAQNGPKTSDHPDNNRGQGLEVARLTQAGAPPLDHWHDELDGDLLWLINTQGSNLSHYAMWPPKLCERLILSMCPAQVCRTCGEPRRRLVGPAEYIDKGGAVVAELDERWRHGRVGLNGDHMAKHSMTRKAPTLGWSDCGHDDYRAGHVLDTFAGTGTTLAVADILGRDATGIDLDPANAALHATRWAQCWRALKPDAGPSPITDGAEQLGLAL
jgi:site-specific DNA-methyltransferase (cytosine-N4-specific)